MLYGFKIKSILTNESVINNNISLDQSVVSQEQMTENDKKITYSSPITYLYDKKNQKNIKISPAYLDNKVAYSLTYKQDVLPSGYLQYNEYFAKEYITTILVNGYPYVSPQEMGLNGENEAYTATQLAIYELISRRNIVDITSGYFAIEDVISTNDENKETVEQIKKVASKLVNLSMENTYNNYYANGIETLENTKYEYDEIKKEGIIGPFRTYVNYNDEIKKILVNDISTNTSFEVINNVPEKSSIHILDENMNRVDSVSTGDIFYFQILGEDSYCANIIIYKEAKFLASDVYKNSTSKNKYVILDTYKASYKNIYSMSKNVDVGKLKVTARDSDNNSLSRFKFYILNEHKEKIIDVSGFDMGTIKLPLGKYYIVEYYAPDGYLLNSNEYEVDLITNDEEKEVIIIQDRIQ